MPNNDQIEALRGKMEQRLGELRARLQGQLASEAGEHYRDIAGEVTDTGDEAVGDELADTENALIGLHVDEVRDIEAALNRIARGSYGRCIDCRDEIDLARLTAYPTCTRCQACQRIQERTHAGGKHASL